MKEILKSSCLVFVLLSFIITPDFAQSKRRYLMANRFDLNAKDFNFPQGNFKMIGFGAYHGSRETEKAEHILLQTLLRSKKIKYYLPETDYSIAHYFNEYLQSGDTVLLRQLVQEYGKRVPQEKTIEVYNKWKETKA